MVEALAALRDHEQASYEYSHSKTTGVDFIRAAHDIRTFLREQAGRTGCTAGQHRADPTPAPADDDDWIEFVGMDEARRDAIDIDELLDDQ